MHPTTTSKTCPVEVMPPRTDGQTLDGLEPGGNVGTMPPCIVFGFNLCPWVQGNSSHEPCYKTVLVQEQETTAATAATTATAAR